MKIFGIGFGFEGVGAAKSIQLRYRDRVVFKDR
jgi:hypothetical protein